MKYDKFDRVSIMTGPAQAEPAYRINPLFSHRGFLLFGL